MTDAQIHELAKTLLGKPVGALDPEEHNVLEDIRDHSLTSQDAADVAEAQATMGQRLADDVAAIGGSWGFIIAFMLVLVAWMVLNSDILGRLHLAFDPYPYIFLNLMLSMLAAIQAPIIMMSQNRQAAKDRLAASLDYEVNLRAEIELMRVHEKIDVSLSGRLDEIARNQRILADMIDQLDARMIRSAP